MPSLSVGRSLEFAISLYLIVHWVGVVFSTEFPYSTVAKQINVSGTLGQSHVATEVGKQVELEKFQPPESEGSSMIIVNGPVSIRKRETITEFTSEFWKLFDELWKINSVSARILANWNVEQNNTNEQKQETRVAWTDSLIDETSTAEPRNTSVTETPAVKEPEVNQAKPEGGGNETINGSDSELHPDPQSHKTTDVNHHQLVMKNAPSSTNFGYQLKIWLLQIHMKIRSFLAMLSRPFVNRYKSIHTSIRHTTTVTMPGDNKKEEDSENREPSAKSLDQGINDDQVRQMEKRQIREDEETKSVSVTTLNNVVNETGISNHTKSCVELDPKRMDECKSTELIVSTNLNTTFLYTLSAIEENCRHITHLLTDCWPKQLHYIKYYVKSSWNETLLETTDFPLQEFNGSHPNNNYGSDASCGTSPQEARPFLDRINWMWLNLCMDRKFRLDYVEHMRCLGMWGDVKSHSICQNEYKRLENYVNPYDASPQAQIQVSQRESSTMTISEGEKSLLMAGAQTNTYRTSGRSGSASNTGVTERIQESSQEKELEKKTHCCLFDVFLRCVHRQSLRDCGRPGSQFVVNFMARIGTDDMKYLCKKELSAMNRGKQVTRKGSSEINDKHPFIESIYCADPRIHNAVYGTKNDDKVRFPGVNVNVTPRPMTSRNNNRGPVSSSYQGDSESNGSCSPNNLELTLIHVFISLVFVIALPRAVQASFANCAFMAQLYL